MDVSMIAGKYIACVILNIIYSMETARLHKKQCY